MNQTARKTESSSTPRTDALEQHLNMIGLIDCALEPIRTIERDNATLRAALEALEKALRTDSRHKSILADTVEYHLDGQAMYQAINKVRAALAGVA